MWLRKIRIENGFPKRKGGKKGEQGEDPAVVRRVGMHKG